jgi:hypothetical protein
MADRHDSGDRESPESPRTGRSGEPGSVTSGAKATERDDTHVSSESEYFSTLDLDGNSPADLAQIQADDLLLDALSAQHAGLDDIDGVDFDDEQLNALLFAWRQDVHSVPVPEIVDTKSAVATVTAARTARRRRPRLLVPVAAAAAVVAVAFAGVGMAARDAEPGDALWGLSKVLYADHARSVEAARSVRTDLKDAQNAIEQGKIDEAKDALEAAGTALSNVSREDGKDRLQREHEELTQQLGNPPNPSPSPSERSETTRPAGTSSVTSPTPSVPPPTNPPSNPPSSQPPSSSRPSTPASGNNEPPPPGGGSGQPPRSDTPSAGTGSGILTNSKETPPQIAPPAS